MLGELIEKGSMAACSVLLEAIGGRRGAQYTDAISLERLDKVSKHFFHWATKTFPRGPRTQIMEYQGPNATI